MMTTTWRSWCHCSVESQTWEWPQTQPGPRLTVDSSLDRWNSSRWTDQHLGTSRLCTKDQSTAMSYEDTMLNTYTARHVYIDRQIDRYFVYYADVKCVALNSWLRESVSIVNLKTNSIAVEIQHVLSDIAVAVIYWLISGGSYWLRLHWRGSYCSEAGKEAGRHCVIQYCS